MPETPENITDEYNRPRFYGDQAMADELRVSKITVFRLRKAGKIGYFELGKKIAYSQKHLEEYLRNAENRAKI